MIEDLVDRLVFILNKTGYVRDKTKVGSIFVSPLSETEPSTVPSQLRTVDASLERLSSL